MSNGSIVDYSDRADHVAHRVLAPDGAPDWATDWKELWRRAADAEKRANAQEARTIEISFPRALVREDWIKLATRLGRLLVEHGMVVQIDIHCPIACDGLPNPHAHFMMTMREIDETGFARLKARHWKKLFHRQASALRRDWARCSTSTASSGGLITTPITARILSAVLRLLRFCWPAGISFTTSAPVRRRQRWKSVIASALPGRRSPVLKPSVRSLSKSTRAPGKNEPPPPTLPPQSTSVRSRLVQPATCEPRTAAFALTNRLPCRNSPIWPRASCQAQGTVRDIRGSDQVPDPRSCGGVSGKS
ncbi:MobA/MobL family protein [Bradyrhizobium centrosematis]